MLQNIDSARHQIAYTARIYKPEKAKSQYRLFLSGDTGQNLRALPIVEEPFRTTWVGKSHLLVQTDEGWHLGDTRSWKPMKIKDSGEYNLQESRNRDYAPGQPEFSIDEQPGYFTFDIATKKFKAITAKRENHDLVMPEEGPTTVKDPNGNELKLEPFEYFFYLSKGKPKESEFEFQRGWQTGNRLFLISGTHSSSSGSVNSLMLLEKGKEPRIIITEANAFDFHESRSEFAYCTPRTTSALGKIQVWSSELHVGDWSKGTDKTILTGAVHVTSVSIQP